MKNRKALTIRVIMTVMTAAAVVAIFYNSMLNAFDSTQQSLPLTEWINSVLTAMHFPFCLSETFVRKAAHFTEYAAMGTLLTVTVFLYRRDRKRTLLTALPTGAAVAVCDEMIQLFSDGRSCEGKDMLIDFSGVAVAALIVILVISKSKKRKMMKDEGR